MTKIELLELAKQHLEKQHYHTPIRCINEVIRMIKEEGINAQPLHNLVFCPDPWHHMIGTYYDLTTSLACKTCGLNFKGALPLPPYVVEKFYETLKNNPPKHLNDSSMYELASKQAEDEVTDNDFCDDCQKYHKGDCKYDTDGSPLIKKQVESEKDGYLNIVCDTCQRTLKKSGALIFHPPINGMCKKEHVCCDCFERRPAVKVDREALAKILYEQRWNRQWLWEDEKNKSTELAWLEKADAIISFLEGGK